MTRIVVLFAMLSSVDALACFCGQTCASTCAHSTDPTCCCSNCDVAACQTCPGAQPVPGPSPSPRVETYTGQCGNGKSCSYTSSGLVCGPWNGYKINITIDFASPIVVTWYADGKTYATQGSWTPDNFYKGIVLTGQVDGSTTLDFHYSHPRGGSPPGTLGGVGGTSVNTVGATSFSNCTYSLPCTDKLVNGQKWVDNTGSNTCATYEYCDGTPGHCQDDVIWCGPQGKYGDIVGQGGISANQACCGCSGGETPP